ncbi:thiol:disulfide interchange protein DsbA/DsbL [Elongatibacter sediminis]|uniref:Thiol:disulfide interchange protein DsbA n=1 Tax=Elongatibacter sediminis TaxID=3119006 RepID=A0AAW9RPS1_9GAMM
MRNGVIRLPVLSGLLLLISGAVFGQSPSGTYQEGIHYSVIPDATVKSDGPVEVVEAFSYLCTHCATFEPYVQSWKKRLPEHVEFKRIPVVFGRSSWELYARAYATAEMMGIADESHPAMMDKLWKERDVMRDMDALGDFYAEFGADPAEFKAMSESFAVDAKMRRDQRRVQNAGVRGTPSLIVNGKYLVAGNAAVANFDVMLDVVDYLVATEAAAMGATAEASAEGAEPELAEAEAVAAD